MNILALDSSDQIFSAALSTESGVFCIEIDAGSRHSELIMESVDTLCKIACLDRDSINMIACMQGPGSFTGLRIGFSAAKGLSLALGIPLVSVPTLDCIAYPFSVWPGIVIPAMDAKKDCFFTSFYRKGERLTDFLDITSEKIATEAAKIRLSRDEALLITGAGGELLFNSLSGFFTEIWLDPSFKRARARELIEISKTVNINEGNVFNSGPSYIRKSDAEINSIIKQ